LVLRDSTGSVSKRESWRVWRVREREREKEREFEESYNKKKSFPAATAAEQAELVSLAPLFTLWVLFGCMILDGANRVSNTTSLFLFLQT